MIFSYCSDLILFLICHKLAKFYGMIGLCGEAEAAGFGRRAVVCVSGMLKEGEEWHFVL